MKPPGRFVFVLVLGATAAWTAVGAQDAPQTPPVAVAAAAPETAATYQGEAAEHFLTRARISQVRTMAEGVTAPQRATLVLDGVTRTAVLKSIDQERAGIMQLDTGQVELNFVDSWRTEVAAYRVDRMIGLGLVPATVERNYRGKSASLQWWLQVEMAEAERARRKIAPPDSEAWNRQTAKMELFDNLIYNTDRHQNNILVTREFEIRLIDHSRSFRQFTYLKPDNRLARFSRSLLAGIATLDREQMRQQIGRYVSRGQIDSLLRRRDAIVALAAKLVAERGEAAVLYP